MKGRSVFDYIKETIVNVPTDSKRYAMLTVFLLAVDGVVAILLFSGSILSKFENGSFTYFGAAIGSSGGLFFTTVLLFLALFFVFIFKSKREVENKIESIDDRGVIYMEKATHGSAKFMSSDEIKQRFDVVYPDEIHSMPFGYIPGTKEVACEKTEKGKVKNATSLIIGCSGTGKTVSLNVPIVMQGIEAGNSMIISDPKAEIHEVTGQYALENGYKKYILNFRDLQYSSFWNCLQVVIDPDTERLDVTALQQFSKVYSVNLNPPEEKQQAYFINGARHLMEAVISYLAFRREHAILIGLQSLYQRIGSGLPDYQENRKEMLEEYEEDGEIIYETPSLKMAKQIIYDAAQRTGHSKKEIDDCIFRIEKEAPVFTMAEVYFMISKFDKPGVVTQNGKEDFKADLEIKDTVFKILPPGHPGIGSFEQFLAIISNSSVSSSMLSNIMDSLSLFVNTDLRIVFSNDGIDLRKIRKEKSIIYVVFNNLNEALHPVLSLFFTFACDICRTQWTKVKDQNKKEGTNIKLLPITFLLDEFSSLGRIGGDSRTFGTTLSDVRSSLITFIMSIQHISQLKQTYGKEFESSITGNCQKVLFLGCDNDIETAEWISKQAGDATVLSEQHNDNTETILDTDTARVGTTQRNLMTPGEVRAFKESGQVLIICSDNGNSVAKLDRFPYFDMSYTKKHGIKEISYQICEPLSVRRKKNRSAFTLDNTTRQFDKAEKGFNDTAWKDKVKKIISKVRKTTNAKPSVTTQISFDELSANDSADNDIVNDLELDIDKNYGIPDTDELEETEDLSDIAQAIIDQDFKDALASAEQNAEEAEETEKPKEAKKPRIKSAGTKKPKSNKRSTSLKDKISI